MDAIGFCILSIDVAEGYRTIVRCIENLYTNLRWMVASVKVKIPNPNGAIVVLDLNCHFRNVVDI